MTNVHTLQSGSKTHVHTFQQFAKFFKKNCQICVIVVFNITSSSTRDLTRFFGICDVEKALLTFPPHSILSFYPYRLTVLCSMYPFNTDTKT